MTATQSAQVLRIMPREMRMMTERVLSLTGLPKGFFLALQDVVMYSQKLGLGGLVLLEERFESFRRADPTRISVSHEEGASLVLDGGEQHAWFLVPSLVDLMGELAHCAGAAEITVFNVIDPAELAVAVPLAARCGIGADFFCERDEARLVASATPEPGKADDPLLRELQQDGVAIEAELWWRIYHLAQRALTPDSVVSRRHAGPLIVNDDGTVIGRKDNDDETDIGFLISPNAGERQTESAGS
jgi:hypothetical protein